LFFFARLLLISCFAWPVIKKKEKIDDEKENKENSRDVATPFFFSLSDWPKEKKKKQKQKLSGSSL
jgi:hypothetical protein